MHNRSHGWVTLRDLTELLTAREKSLQHCAAELCKREMALDDERPTAQGAREQIHGLTPEIGMHREGGASVVTIAA
jgi:hypothetical protein